MLLLKPASAGSDDLRQWRNAAAEQRLSESRAWLALGHYHRSGAGWLSEVDDPDFFLADDGKRNPRAELRATLEAFAAAGGDAPDRHGRCRFPARFHWLMQVLDAGEAPAPVEACPDFGQWYGELDPAGVSLIFPAAYLNNPSSMFGHTFLRIDGRNQDEQSRLLAYSVNYGANVPDEAGQLATIINGLTGGYPGTLSGEPYYDKVIEYSDIEARDIWEYRLNLTAAQTRQLLRHIWELREVEFDYFFFDENCSYRLLTLLEAARPGARLSADFATHTIPADTVRVLDREGLLGSRVYRPSTVTRLKARIRWLERRYRAVAHELALGERAPGQLPADADPRQQARIVELAYEYSRYRARQEPHRRDFFAGRSMALLRHRSALPTLDPPPIPEPVSPDRGHRTARLNLAAGRVEDNRYTSLRLRPAFHDLLDARDGYVPGSQINFLDAELRRYDNPPAAGDDRLQLHRLDLVSIVSLTPRSRFFKPHSWLVRAGWQRVLERPEQTTRFVFEGGRGLAYGLGGHATAYLLADLVVQSAADLGGEYEGALGAHAGLIGSVGRTTIRARYRHRAFDGDNPSDGGVGGLDVNWPLGRNHAVRLGYEHADLQAREYDTVRLGWNWYF